MARSGFDVGRFDEHVDHAGGICRMFTRMGEDWSVPRLSRCSPVGDDCHDGGPHPRGMTVVANLGTITDCP